MTYVYKLYMFSTNYAIEDKHEVYKGSLGIFSSREEAEKAIAEFIPIRWKYEKLDEDGIDNIRVIAFHIYKEPLNVCECNCTNSIFIYDANGKLLERQYGRGYACDFPFAGKAQSELAFKKGEVVYADIHSNNCCELAVIAEVPLSPKRAAKLNAACDDDVYMVYTADCEHSHMRPNQLYPILTPLKENTQMLFSLVAQVAESRSPKHND